MRERCFIDENNAIVIPSCFRNMFDKKAVIFVKDDNVFISPL